jgi:hypothetical protein
LYQQFSLFSEERKMEIQFVGNVYGLLFGKLFVGRRREETVDNRVPWSLGLLRSSEGSLKIICIEKPFRKFYAMFPEFIA